MWRIAISLGCLLALSACQALPTPLMQALPTWLGGAEPAGTVSGGGASASDEDAEEDMSSKPRATDRASAPASTPRANSRRIDVVLPGGGIVK